MTLKQLAERVALTANSLGTVENGIPDPSLATILALAKGLGITPAELFALVLSAGPEDA